MSMAGGSRASRGRRSIRMCAAAMLVAVVGFGADIVAAPPSDLDVIGGTASTHIIARLDRTFARAARNGAGQRGVLRDADARRIMGAALYDTWARSGATEMEPAYPFAFNHPELSAKHRLDRYYIIRFPRGTDTTARANEFRAHRREFEMVTTDAIGGVAGYIPDDASFSSQWNMNNTGQSGGTEDADVDAPEAWDIHTGLTGDVTIAIIDSGVSPHSEFGDRLIGGINTDNPITPDLTEDECGSGHGTHVAGIAAATGNNGVGVAGMTWGAKIMPVRVLGTPDPCRGATVSLANGIIWAADHGADIASISLQYYDIQNCVLSPAAEDNLQDAIDFAHDLGVVIVAATGNNGGPSSCWPGFVTYPARLDHVIAVAGTDDDDEIARFSNWGEQVDVAAPGDWILSTLATPTTSETYGTLAGTSMATPHVSGLAALMKSYVPELTSAAVEQIIVDTVDDLGPLGWDVDFGEGRINAPAALVAAGDWPRIVSSLPPDGSIDARQPHDLNDADTPKGLTFVYVNFPGPVSGLLPEDFTISQEGGVAGTPTVATVEQLATDRVKVILDSPLEPGAWTTITHVASGTSTRIGYLPGDVDAGGVSNAEDVAVLMAGLSGEIDRLDLWAADIDYSLHQHPADVLRLIDLLNGAGAFDVYDGASLP